MTTKVTTLGMAVLVALRASTALKREPGISSDGHRRFFSLEELESEGQFSGIGADDMAGLSRAARGLYKKRLVVTRTQFTRTRWAITPEGLAVVAEIERAAGVSEAVAARLAWQQALYDADRVKKAYTASLAAAQEAEDKFHAAEAALPGCSPDLVAEVLAR